MVSEEHKELSERNWACYCVTVWGFRVELCLCFIGFLMFLLWLTLQNPEKDKWQSPSEQWYMTWPFHSGLSRDLVKAEETAALGTGDHSVASAGLTNHLAPLATFYALGVCESRRRALCNQGAGSYSWAGDDVGSWCPREAGCQRDPGAQGSVWTPSPAAALSPQASSLSCLLSAV